jgi:hypothetical protein
VARLLSVLRLLVLLTKRDLNGIASVGLNNLVFCAVFLVQGSVPKHIFLELLPIQILLLVPLLFAMSADALSRVPRERMALWPLSSAQRFGIGVASLALSPAFWLFSAAIFLMGGVTWGLCFLMLAVGVQVLVWLVFLLRQGRSQTLMRWVPRFPGRLGGIVQVELRHILTTLDFYAALMLCVAGSCYRFFAKAPQVEAYPILALLIGVALSTYAQRTFALDGTGGVARYRLLPLRGWQLLAAKDVAYLLVGGALVLPLGLLPGMTFHFVALAIGRYPALRLGVPQRAWRFMSGDIRFGALQILLGVIAGLGCARVSSLFLLAAVGLYAVSLYAGGRWWEAPHSQR